MLHVYKINTYEYSLVVLTQQNKAVVHLNCINQTGIVPIPQEIYFLEVCN